MHRVLSAVWFEIIHRLQRVLATQYLFRARLTSAWRGGDVSASKTSPVWCGHKDVLHLKPGIHYVFCPDFPPILQSEEVDASWGKSEPVCRLHLTDSTENLIVYYGHRLRFFSFRFWLYRVGGYQTCLIFSADFRRHMFSFVMCLLATRCTFLREFVVIGTTLKSGSVWSSDT